MTVRHVLDAYPDVGFPLVLKLLSGLFGGFVISSNEPSIAPWARLSWEERKARAEGEADGNVAELVKIAIHAAGADAPRWALLLPVVNHLGGELEQQALLELARVVRVEAEGAALVWAALRETLHRDTLFDPGKGPASRTLRSDLYGRFTPADLVPRYTWLFGGPINFPDGNEDDWTATAERIGKERQDALDVLWRAPERMDLLLRLAATVRDSSILGHALGRTSFVSDLDQYLLGEAATSFPSVLRASYVAMRVALGADEQWLTNVLQELVSAERFDDAYEMAVRLPSTLATWELLDRVSKRLAETFWMRVEHFFTQGVPTASIEYLIRRCLAAGNVATAVEAAFHAREQLDATILAGALEKLTGREQERFFGRQTAHYMIQESLKHLDGAGAAPSRLAVLELRFLPVFREGGYQPKHFSAAMADEPGHFVNLVTSLYRRADGAPDPGTVDGASEQRAASAYHVLEAWRGYPGEGDPEDEREARLLMWAASALDGLASAGRGEVGTTEVARVLARAPGDGGHWPCAAARELLEKGAGVDLASCLATAKRNLRGMTSRAVGEGGRQERILAKQYRTSAAALRARWPQTAAMFDMLARSYADEGSRRDVAAKAIRRREGLDIPPTSDELPPSARTPDGAPKA